MDLAQMNAFESHNDGYKYILCIIDCFTRFAYCVPLKSKTSEVVLAAVKKVIKDSDREPEKIWCDKGSEFYNKDFKRWADEKDIVIYSTYGESKSAVVERFIRTLKELITPIFTETNSRNWVSILPDVMKKYNNRVHSSIDMTPAEASDPKNATKVFLKLHEQKSSKKQKNVPNFHVGDNVRISRQKDVFEKDGYNFSYEVFKVDKVLDTDPITYNS